jgi:hypothetical protein
LARENNRGFPEKLGNFVALNRDFPVLLFELYICLPYLVKISSILIKHTNFLRDRL